MLVLAPVHLRAAPERATSSHPLVAAARRADLRGTAEQLVARAAESSQVALAMLQEALLALAEAPLLPRPALLLPQPAPPLARHLAGVRWLAPLDR
jgi:hypothetical protein